MVATRKHCWICALGAKQILRYVICFSGINYSFLYAHYYTNKVRINYIVYDHVDTSIKDMIIGSHN